MTILATAAAAAVWLGAGLISEAFPKLTEPQRAAAASALQFSAIVIWTRLLQQIPLGVQQACHRYGLMNTLNTAQQALSNLGLLWVAWMGGRTVAFMQWQALVGVLALLAHGIAGYVLLRPMGLRPGWDSVRGREIGRYSFLTWTSALGTLLFSQCDRLIIGSILNTAALGTYAAITSITSQINAISALPVQPLLPLISRLAADGRAMTDELGRSVRQAMQMNVLAALVLGAGLTSLAPLVMKVLLPDASRESALLFQIAAVIYALYSMNAGGYFVLLGASQVGVCTKVVLFSGLFALLLIALGSYFLGLLGGVLGNAGYIATWTLTFLGLRHLQIPASEWSGWIRFPLAWFCVVTPIHFLLPDSLWWRVPLLAIELAALGAWWLRRVRVPLAPLFRKPG